MLRRAAGKSSASGRLHICAHTPVGGDIDAVFDVRPWAEVAWTPSLDDARQWARSVLRPGDLCLTVGAGDVHELGPLLVADLQGLTPS